jgi:hypothetical protein
MSQSIQAANTLLEIIESTVMNEHTVQAARRLIAAWRVEQDKHAQRVANYSSKAQALCDRVDALKVLRKELESNIAELRQTYQTQLMTATMTTPEAWGEDHANFIRAARLLIEAGKPLTEQTLTALGLTLPKKGTRPTEHWVRSVATVVLPCLGFHVLHSQSAHPDLICEYQGQTIGVEVEVSLRDYNAHGHDAADAHMIVIWQNPTRMDISDEGFFVAAKCESGYSPRLSVITLQTPGVLGSLHQVGNKRALKYTANA